MEASSYMGSILLQGQHPTDSAAADYQGSLQNETRPQNETIIPKPDMPPIMFLDPTGQ